MGRCYIDEIKTIYFFIVIGGAEMNSNYKRNGSNAGNHTYRVLQTIKTRPNIPTCLLEWVVFTNFGI